MKELVAVFVIVLFRCLSVVVEHLGEKGGLIADVIQTTIKTVIKITKTTTILETCSHICACLG